MKIGRFTLEESSKNTIVKMDITYKEQTSTIWFAFDCKWRKYLVLDRADAIFIMLLPFAMHNNEPLEFELPISERLYYQIRNLYMPAVTENDYYNKTLIQCQLIKDDIQSAGATATALSCGVDSFYTVIKHRNLEESSYNIDYLTYFNLGGIGSYGGDFSRNLYHEKLDIIRKCAEEFDLPLITIDSNINEFMHIGNVYSHSFRQMGAALFLQKLISVYYYSSSYVINQFSMKTLDSSRYDILNVEAFSTNATTFYSYGEINRIEKMKEISKNPLSRRYLNVCVRTKNNCGKCEKCLRTLYSLESIHELEEYQSLFDMELFQKEHDKQLGYFILYRKNILYHELMMSYQKNNVKISWRAYVYAYTYWLYKRIRKKR